MKKEIKAVLLMILGVIAGGIVGGIAVGKRMCIFLGRMRRLSDKYQALFLMMNQWVKQKQNGKSLVSYFEKRGYKIIAIYGMSYVGETLVDELKSSKIQIGYGIDQRAHTICSNIEIITMEDPLPDVDVIIVTAIGNFDDIQNKLSVKVCCPIISLEDILYEI